MTPPPITVVSVGCIGGLLATLLDAYAPGAAADSASRDVLALDRAGARHDAVLAAGTLEVITPERGRVRADARALLCVDARRALAAGSDGRPRVVLVATKRSANKAVARDVARFASKGTVVVMVQNGLDAAAEFRAAVAEARAESGQALAQDDVVVLDAVITCNVVPTPPPSGTDPANAPRNSFTWVTPRGKSFVVIDGTPIADDAGTLARVSAVASRLTEAGIQSYVDCAEFRSVACGKLLINMANAPNALAGCDTQTLIETYGYRRVWSATVAEAQAVFAAGGVVPKSPRGEDDARINALSTLLSLPTFAVKLVLRASGQKLGGKTSMAQDLDNRASETEIDSLHGKVVEWGERVGVPTPVTKRLVELVHEATDRGEGSPHYSPDELQRLVGLPPASPFAGCAVQ